MLVVGNLYLYLLLFVLDGAKQRRVVGKFEPGLASSLKRKQKKKEEPIVTRKKKLDYGLERSVSNKKTDANDVIEAPSIGTICPRAIRYTIRKLVSGFGFLHFHAGENCAYE